MFSRISRSSAYNKLCESSFVKDLPKTYLFKASKYLFCLSIVAVAVAGVATAIFYLGPYSIHFASKALLFAKWSVIVSASVFVLSITVWALNKIFQKVEQREQQLYPNEHPPAPPK